MNVEVDRAFDLFDRQRWDRSEQRLMQVRSSLPRAFIRPSGSSAFAVVNRPKTKFSKPTTSFAPGTSSVSSFPDNVSPRYAEVERRLAVRHARVAHMIEATRDVRVETPASLHIDGQRGTSGTERASRCRPTRPAEAARDPWFWLTHAAPSHAGRTSHRPSRRRAARFARPRCLPRPRARAKRPPRWFRCDHGSRRTSARASRARLPRGHRCAR